MPDTAASAQRGPVAALIRGLRHLWTDTPHPNPLVDQRLARAYILDTRDTPFSAAFVAAMFWITFLVLTGDKGTLVWAVLVHGMQVSMYFHLHGERPEDYPAEEAFRIRRRLETRMLFPGLVWALAPWLFFPSGQLPYILLMYFFISGMTSGSTMATAHWWRAAALFAIPGYLSLSARLIWEGDNLTILMGVLALVQLWSALFYSYKQHRIIVESIEKGFENTRLAQALAHELDQVAALAAQRTRIFAAANHDLRQPMHALSIFVDALSPKTPPAADTLHAMRDSVDALRTSVDALLDIAQFDGDSDKAATDAVALVPLMRSLRSRFEPMAASKGLALRFAVPDVAVRSDGRVLSRLMGNLIDNAIKYTPRGTVMVAVRRATAQGRPAWRLEVRDSGIGIDEQHAEQVFEAFFQLDNPGRDRSRGLGLGLSLVASMARMLGSRIHLRSRPGRGSVFSVTLPAAPVADFAPESAPAPLASAAPRRVLVLDDEEPVRRAMATLLRAWGHDVAVAANPDEAWAHPGQFDLLLGDLRLGSGLSGLSTAQALHGQGKVRRVAILTGETASSHRSEVELAGFALLYKPADAKRLRALLAA
ncbi:ATP-binding protein [Variovorax dokdonensis]|uniref:histidine kinase n=1 Tax=Variovorax dokdonensis TaxID=344883 RepID=A0ABT7N4N9_9BURK|nr:ATP-binding protein [Variovorax dokdonensis]MDM0042901.1 ATP-binding protein [Variovorax dokdonensis]